MHYASSGKMYYHLFIFFIIFITLNYVTLPVDRKKFTFVDKIVSRYSIYIYIYFRISRDKSTFDSAFTALKIVSQRSRRASELLSKPNYKASNSRR